MAVQNETSATPFEYASSNVFDSLDSVNLSQGECEATLAQLLITTCKPVLSLPQAGDVQAVFHLACNPNFRRLLSMGHITVSLYGTFKSLQDYIVSRLAQPTFVFSSLPCLKKMNEEDRTATKAILRAVLLGETVDLGDLPDAAKQHGEELDLFCRGNRYLQEAIPCYEQNLPVSISFPQLLRHNIDKTKTDDPQLVKTFHSLVDEAYVDRSFYHLDPWQQKKRDMIEFSTLEHFMTLVDYAYNELIGMRLAPRHHWLFGEKYKKIRPEIEETLMNMKSDSELYYQLFQTDAHAPTTGTERLNWTTLREIITEMRTLAERDASITAEKLRRIITDQRLAEYGYYKGIRASLLLHATTGTDIFVTDVPVEQEDTYMVHHNNNL